MLDVGRRAAVGFGRIATGSLRPAAAAELKPQRCAPSPALASMARKTRSYFLYDLRRSVLERLRLSPRRDQPKRHPGWKPNGSGLRTAFQAKKARTSA